ncbi:sulfatase-like hydrolase/transferase [Candidatus Poribacteria bacterium]|nr:sulfatase-like hydrolase/transferase [Candidatus Poribacteria bacterium]
MQDKKPNIVLMVADDHGLDTGCYGNPGIKTPNLDAIAQEGVVFDNAFCTTASCAASRSVILTGIYNHTNGTYGHTHGCHHFACFDNVTTLPALLNEAGYRTARVGKKHYAPERIFPFQHGHPQGKFGRNDVLMSENCREFITGDAPFFLYWCSMNPHRGGGIIEEHPCRPDRFGNPKQNFPNDEEMVYSDDEVYVPPYLPNTPETRAELVQYCQSVSRLDRGVGRLMDILKEEGKYENTVMIYISDNGPAFHGAKTTLYEPGMNLPCIVKSPLHQSKGTRCDGLVTWADLTPTVLDFAGAYKNPEDFHGRSFKDIVDQESPEDWRDEVYAAHTFHEITNYYPMRVVRQKRYKFIWNIAHPLTYSSASDLWISATWQGVLKDRLEKYGERSLQSYLHRSKFELYDLEKDPFEVNNLADKTEYAELVEEFCLKIKNFQKKTNDPWIHKWEYE